MVAPKTRDEATQDLKACKERKAAHEAAIVELQKKIDERRNAIKDEEKCEKKLNQLIRDLNDIEDTKRKREVIETKNEAKERKKARNNATKDMAGCCRHEEHGRRCGAQISQICPWQWYCYKHAMATFHSIAPVPHQPP